jgi:cytochrome c-type biogenesis protein CcmE
MKRKQLKFIGGSVVIILTLAFLAYSGYQESKAYFNTVPELYAMKDQAYDVRLQVSGDVVPGSRKYEGKVVDFVIADAQKPDQTLKVKYVGTDPLPDTFVDRATAIVTGQYGRDGVFVANKMTAKCASKYEKEAAAGVYETKKSDNKVTSDND